MADVATESIKDEAVATTPAVLSKNQAKKQKKHEMRLLAKQLKKEQSKKRKIGDIEAIDAVKIEENSEQLENRLKVPQYIANEKSKNERKLREAEENERKCASNFSVVIDCDWEDKHSEGTMKSLTQQLMFCYGINRKHECPAAMYLTGVGPKITANLSKSNFKNWQGVQILSESYLDLSAFTLDAIEPDDMSGKKQLVYLTSDAEETLESLDPKCAYIIGGIVDRNRHKFATFNKAKAQGVRVAKLPIKENFALAATHILTVNHVYEILLNYAKYKCWVQAIREVMPNRKCPIEKSIGSTDGPAVVSSSSADDIMAGEQVGNESKDMGDTADAVDKESTVL